jgi:DNA invertase Pin-like site-specific DNA recombinase
MIDRQPVAYVRRSFSRRHDPGDVSREFQVDEVRRLAGDDAGSLVIKAGDWGISAAREHTERRLDFLEMIEMVKRGEVSTLYAYSADRLARSVQWSARLLDACEDAGTTIVTGEGRYAPDDDAGRMMFGFLALQNEAALRQMVKKTRASYAVREARGDYLGPAPYGSKVVAGKLGRTPAEPIAKVRAAYRRAGTLQGAARLLNARKVPTRSGKPWRATTLRGILGRDGLLPRRAARGRTPARAYLLAKLLRCPCGATLTGRVNTKGRRGFAYECKQAASRPGHGPYSVSEARLLPLIRAEADRLAPPDAVVMGGADAEVRRAELLEARERVTETYLDPRSKMTKDVRGARWDAIDAELDRLDFVERVVEIPGAVDWTQPTAIVNGVLRAMWERVELGPDLLPKPDGFAWRRPEWRA